ncbi:hypothetical protein PR202_gb06339 [Eleusine coracana subsp. coracana]|uniref:Knottins-like domain-containing protein n=1 Tax=Eleusine coracana subsp. coracana TaxID=191504 RepID=A0AAV5E9C6_ELECO|nr:hypothetical protein PR202_gb06339 [Eleusine coracana subsp. coracana]
MRSPLRRTPQQPWSLNIFFLDCIGSHEADAKPVQSGRGNVILLGCRSDARSTRNILFLCSHLSNTLNNILIKQQAANQFQALFHLVMASKAVLVASALVLALVFIASSGGGVEGWCITVPGPNIYVCLVSDGRRVCDAQCREVGYNGGGLCSNIGECLCAKYRCSTPEKPRNRSAMKMLELKVAASAAVILLLLTAADQVQAGTIGGPECTVAHRSTTFKGVCTTAACVAACRHELYTEGHCFMDVSDPDHRVCMCTKPCPPPEPDK